MKPVKKESLGIPQTLQVKTVEKPRLESYEILMKMRAILWPIN